MTRVNADYVCFVHGGSALMGHDPAMRLIDMALKSNQFVTVDLGDSEVRHELLTGAEAYSANAYSDRSLARTAQRLFQNIHKWEHERERSSDG